MNPQVDICFSALGKPLFAAHAGACAQLVRETTQGTGRVAAKLLKTRKPAFYNGLVQGFALAKQLLADPKKE